YSTYLGGDDYEIASSIAVDTADNAYVTGDTFSGNFPLSNALQSTLAGTQDAFVTKLNSSGTALVYSTYLGGNNTENARGIETDGAGNAYITGNSASPDFPISNALQPALAGGDDAFVTKLNANGTALVYSTYLGGNGDDFGFGITIDSNHDAYVTGSTRSANFPLSNAFQSVRAGIQDVFVTKLNTSGTALVYSTYLGGNNTETGRRIAADSAGNAYLTGNTASSNFPLSNALQGVLAG